MTSMSSAPQPKRTEEEEPTKKALILSFTLWNLQCTSGTIATNLRLQVRLMRLPPPRYLNEVLNLARADDDDDDDKTEEENTITQGSLFEWGPGPRLFKVVQIGDDGLISCLCPGPRGVI
jgi:hypothetical protein